MANKEHETLLTRQKPSFSFRLIMVLIALVANSSPVQAEMISCDDDAGRLTQLVSGPSPLVEDQWRESFGFTIEHKGEIYWDMSLGLFLTEAKGYLTSQYDLKIFPVDHYHLEAETDDISLRVLIKDVDPIASLDAVLNRHGSASLIGMYDQYELILETDNCTLVRAVKDGLFQSETHDLVITRFSGSYQDRDEIYPVLSEQNSSCISQAILYHAGFVGAFTSPYQFVGGFSPQEWLYDRRILWDLAAQPRVHTLLTDREEINSADSEDLFLAECEAGTLR